MIYHRLLILYGVFFSAVLIHSMDIYFMGCQPNPSRPPASISWPPCTHRQRQSPFVFVKSKALQLAGREKWAALWRCRRSSVQLNGGWQLISVTLRMAAASTTKRLQPAALNPYKWWWRGVTPHWEDHTHTPASSKNMLYVCIQEYRWAYTKYTVAVSSIQWLRQRLSTSHVILVY